MADKVVSPSCFRSSLPSCPFSWRPFCHSFSPSVVVESGNVSRPSMYSLLDNVYDVIYTCLMSYPGIMCVVTKGNGEHDAHATKRFWVRILLVPLRNFGNFVNPTFPVSFVRDTKSLWSILSGVYAGEVKDHIRITHVTTLKVSKLIVSSIVIRRKERLHHLTTQIVMPT